MKESPLASLPMTPLMRRTIGAPALVEKPDATIISKRGRAKRPKPP
jgi:hypothetical protein